MDSVNCSDSKDIKFFDLGIHQHPSPTLNFDKKANSDKTFSKNHQMEFFHQGKMG